MDAMNRRQFIAGTAAGLALPAFGAPEALLKGKAEHVISIWLGGGMAQIDTLDPKRKGDPKARKPGCYYDSIETWSRSQVDRASVAIGSVDGPHHRRPHRLSHRDRRTRGCHESYAYRLLDQRNGHLPFHRMNTAYERGAARGAPPYVLAGYPNVTVVPAGPAGYPYTTDTSQGPAGLSRPEGITAACQSCRERFLLPAKDSHLIPAVTMTPPSSKASNSADRNSIAPSKSAMNPPSGHMANSVNVACSPADWSNAASASEVAHNLNFLNGIGWDVHHEGIEDQHELIKELDTAMSALILDLKEKRLLDKTLIVITTEFGRPPEFDARGGRAHQGRAFTCVLAGGGLKPRRLPQTDELSKKAVGERVSVPDFFATICAAVGVNYRKNLYDGDRPVPITDRGNPIQSLFG